MADTPKRRWFQFRLRTLLVCVALIGAAFGYVARESNIALSRRLLLANEWCFQAMPRLDGEKLSIIRQWLGDKPIGRIDLEPLPPDDVVNRYRRAFPEAMVVWASRQPAGRLLQGNSKR